MNDFAKFVAPSTGYVGEPSASEASDCLDRFTHAFNACDLGGMDAQLMFPHIMLSGAERLEWTDPGQHPADFFDRLKASGWVETEYLRKEVVLASADKVHFVVAYTRKNAAGEVLSTHENLWIVVRASGSWKISLRSY